MRTLRWLIALVLLCGPIALGGCSTDAPSGVEMENTGSATLQLRLADGGSLDSAQYVVTGPGAFIRSGTIDLSNSSTLSTTIGGIPAGTGYLITINATATDSSTTCAGSATFDVTAHATVLVLVKLTCHEPPRQGNVSVKGVLNFCPVIDSLVADVAEATLGHKIALSSAAHDSDGGPAPLSYNWQTTAGTLSDPAVGNPTLTCTTVGDATLTLTVTDGDCSDNLALTVTCSAGPPDAGASGDATADVEPVVDATVVDATVVDATVVDATVVDATVDAGVVVDASADTGATVEAGADASQGSTDAGTDAAPVESSVKINEVESNLGVPGDWTELYNSGTANVDISGWIFKDNDNTHSDAIPAGTILAPGGYYLIEEAAQGFGLGAADSARLYDATGTNLIDSFTWTAHATTTYGRCPNGSGPLVITGGSTKGAPNDCGAGGVPEGGADAQADVQTADSQATDTGAGSSDASDAAVTSVDPWPGTNAVVTIDGTNVFGTNLSDLSYQPAQGNDPAILWAIQNGPPTLYRLVFDGSIWTSSTDNGWSVGKALHYATGLGAPDSEGLTKAELDSPAMYVASERDNNASTISRNSVLRFDTDSVDTSLTATNDWNLTSDLPVVGANLGLEAITYVPDTFLVANQFFDESTGSPYDPSHYPNHGTGIFLVGVEANGIVYAYAFDHVGGGFQRIATFSSGHAGVMSLQFDREVGNLWSYCDNVCGNKAGVLQIDTNPASPTRGRFVLRRIFDHPGTLPNSNNEGTAFAPESECVSGFKSFFWTDDDQLGGHAIRRDSIPCGSFF